MSCTLGSKNDGKSREASRVSPLFSLQVNRKFRSKTSLADAEISPLYPFSNDQTSTAIARSDYLRPQASRILRFRTSAPQLSATVCSGLRTGNPKGFQEVGMPDAGPSSQSPVSGRHASRFAENPSEQHPRHCLPRVPGDLGSGEALYQKKYVTAQPERRF